MISKSVWNLPGGPWDRLFAGTWNKFNVAVYENKEKVLLTTIFPKSGEINWIMVRVDKILIVPDKIEKLSPKLKGKNLHIIQQQLPDRHITYLLLLSPPTTVEFGSKAINAEVLEKVVKINDEAEEVKRIADKEGVKVVDLKDASHKESAGILGNPSLLLGLLSISPEAGEPKKERVSEIPLGDDESGVVKIPEDFFSTFISVKKGIEEERRYVAQMIVESSILDPLPIPIILDYGEFPLKLDQGNPYPYEYERYGIDSANVGFKTQYVDVSEPDSFKINLNQASPEYIWRLLGIGKDQSSSLIMQAACNLQQSGKLDTIDDLILGVKGTKPSNDRDAFFISRAVRILEVAKKLYGPIFSKRIDARSIVSDWIKRNKTPYLNLFKLNSFSRLAFTNFILDMLGGLKDNPALSVIEQKRAVHVFLVILNLEWMEGGAFQKQLVQRLLDTKMMGALFVNEGDLPMEIESRVAYKFNVTGPKSVKMYVGGKGKQFTVRPLITCPP
jgi:hypothetical protein